MSRRKWLQVLRRAWRLTAIIWSLLRALLCGADDVWGAVGRSERPGLSRGAEVGPDQERMDTNLRRLHRARVEASEWRAKELYSIIGRWL
ncbi:hypothetical protein BU26DRAFT_61328 [Trematosphaeria pertusa]|uniref:Secreted protein n=1 Tax=Trematosphaeria pertusa TaxID=390896 RepID=A0A6A6I7K7_9PLEO|nr:uncharacterized protein BU26DRAFT_61328 [Trematosphaeria pertusa]KAF2246058.1 hypothetical protein BU26DRAFT_61328 [Trematosphaeria pertusa]